MKWKDVDAALENVQTLHRLILDAKIETLVGRRVRFVDGGEATIVQAYPVFGDHGVVAQWEIDIDEEGYGPTLSLPLVDVTLVEDESSTETD